MWLLTLLAVFVVGLFWFRKKDAKKSPHVLIERDHAIVIGGSIGGMMAAASLSSKFKKVTVIERDSLSWERPQSRKGTPQADHAHGLLVLGLNIFSEIYPGLADELITNGAVLLPFGEQLINMNGLRRPMWTESEGQIKGLLCSRNFIEYEHLLNFSALSQFLGTTCEEERDK